MVDLRNQFIAEALGTTLLLVIVIKSGIMAERLTGGNVAVALLTNTTVTVDSLYILVEVFEPINDAYFNPTVHVVMAARTKLPDSALAPYIMAQLMGTVLSAWLAYAIFDMTILQLSTKVCNRPGQWIAETAVAIGLLLVILRAPNGRVSFAVAAYIGVAYWSMASTSFTSPMAASGHMFNNGFAGIALSNIPSFVLAEYVGAVLGLMLRRMLEPRLACHGHPNVIESSGKYPADWLLQ